MAFEDVMGKVQGWAVATEALGVLGAKLALAQQGITASSSIASAFDEVIAAAGLDEVAHLPPQQQAMVLGLTRMFVRQAADLLDEPERPPGWTFTDPDILDGWGRGSMMVPPMIAAATPALAQVSRFLDVGTGVGLLACSAATTWPGSTIVGIDVWGPSLARAKANIDGAGLADRIELREQRVEDLADVDAYDCAWVPMFFLADGVLEKALPFVIRAVHEGGWIVLGRMRTPPDPLARALLALRTVRGGGTDVTVEKATALLEANGCRAVEVPPSPSPVELVIGQRR